MGRLFGTDGVRGIANTELTCDLAFKLGRAGAFVLSGENAKRPRILVGKDTRRSGDMLESALVAGICSAGAQAILAGVVPTPQWLVLYENTAVMQGLSFRHPTTLPSSTVSSSSTRRAINCWMRLRKE